MIGVDMRVGISCQLKGAVTDHVLKVLQIAARDDHSRGVGMAQIMQPVRLLYPRLQLYPPPAAGKRFGRAAHDTLRWRQSVRPAQDLQELRLDRHTAHTGVALWRRRLQLPVDADQLLANLDLARRQIDVSPAQSEKFSPSKARP